LDVDFIFTQSETSSNFDTQKIGQFCFGAKDIFQEESKLKQNNEIKLKKTIIDKIYTNSNKFKKRKPNLFLYYATTGKWVDDSNLTIRSEAERSDIESLSLFEKVKFDFIDADKIRKLYMKVNTGVSQEIKIGQFTIFPKLENVDQSFIALLDSNEFIKLLLNDDGSINQSIFYDNIRDWQELNSVNTEIADTINSNLDQQYFHLLNNGVTIVADEIRQTGNVFYLENYQIVNGCQTSYAIFNNKEKIINPITIPVKLISTTNQEIKNKIIKATNRQTPITDDMLYALSELPKKLETYFDSYSGEGKLYFERRSKQYSRDESIDKTRIINLQNLVRAFASAFLNLPHQTTRNYKNLLKSNNTKIFSTDNVFEMYYLCSLLNYKIEKKIKNKSLGTNYRPSKWHIIMCYLQFSYTKMPNFNSSEMSKLCKGIIEEIADPVKFEKKIEKIIRIIDKVSGGNLQRDNVRTEVFTRNVAERIADIKKQETTNA
jgi:hypothetical protein